MHYFQIFSNKKFMRKILVFTDLMFINLKSSKNQVNFINRKQTKTVRKTKFSLHYRLSELNNLINHRPITNK